MEKIITKPQTMKITINGEEYLSMPWTECLNETFGTASLDEPIPEGTFRIVYHCPKCKVHKARYEDNVWSCRNCGLVDDMKDWK